MKIILAQLRKDLVSARGLVWGWAICLAIECLFFVGHRLPVFALRHDQHSFGVLAFWMMGMTTGVLAAIVLQLLLFILLVVRVVHEDLLIEPNAFWRTRPISRPVLLTEKLLLILLLLAAELLTGLAAGLNLGNRTGWTGVLHILEFVAGLVAFAVVTSNLSRLILTALVIAVVTRLSADLFLSLIHQMPWLHSAHSRAASGEHFTWFASPPPWEMGLFYTAGFILVIVWQYLTLRTNVARGILGATFFLAALWQAN